MEDEKEKENVMNVSSPQSRLREISSASGPWLHAWYDPMAHLKSTSSRIATVDITNDGNHALLVVDDSKRLKVFRGMNLISSHKLLDHASCLSIFYPSSLQQQQQQKQSNKNNNNISSSLPAVGVGTGSYIYIYRSMRPYYKFTLPTIKINSDELSIWNQARNNDNNNISNQEILKLLKDLQKNENISLTFRTSFILSITDYSEQLKYIESYKSSELISNTCITCMTSIKKQDNETNSVSSLIIGTENNEILFLDCSGCNIDKIIKIPSVPFILNVIGLLSIDYRIIIATRSNIIYTIRNGKLLGNLIQLESAITAMSAFNKNIIISCINKTLYSYHIKGNNVKLWSLYFKNMITTIEPMVGNKFQGIENNYFLCGFENGHIAMYNNNQQIHLLKFDQSPITALKFGKYGRENSTLIILNQSGCLNVKIISRRININNIKNENQFNKNNSQLIQQEIPLDLPKITQLYLDQEIREKENSQNMYKIWQKEIVKFRLKTNNQYLTMLKKGNNPIQDNQSNNNNVLGKILLNIQIIGLGPLFKLQIQLKNIGKSIINLIKIVLSYNKNYYLIKKSVLNIPLLIPSLDYKYFINIKCIEPNGNSTPIKLLIIDDKSLLHFPFMSAIVDMPISEII